MLSVLSSFFNIISVSRAHDQFLILFATNLHTLYIFLSIPKDFMVDNK